MTSRSAGHQKPSARPTHLQRWRQLPVGGYGPRKVVLLELQDLEGAVQRPVGGDWPRQGAVLQVKLRQLGRQHPAGRQGRVEPARRATPAGGGFWVGVEGAGDRGARREATPGAVQQVSACTASPKLQKRRREAHPLLHGCASCVPPALPPCYYRATTCAPTCCWRSPRPSGYPASQWG